MSFKMNFKIAITSKTKFKHCFTVLFVLFSLVNFSKISTSQNFEANFLPLMTDFFFETFYTTLLPLIRRYSCFNFIVNHLFRCFYGFFFKEKTSIKLLRIEEFVHCRKINVLKSFVLLSIPNG
jgi:hypothetical protein